MAQRTIDPDTLDTFEARFGAPVSASQADGTRMVVPAIDVGIMEAGGVRYTPRAALVFSGVRAASRRVQDYADGKLVGDPYDVVDHAGSPAGEPYILEGIEGCPPRRYVLAWNVDAAGLSLWLPEDARWSDAPSGGEQNIGGAAFLATAPADLLALIDR